MAAELNAQLTFIQNRQRYAAKEMVPRLQSLSTWWLKGCHMIRWIIVHNVSYKWPDLSREKKPQ